MREILPVILSLWCSYSIFYQDFAGDFFYHKSGIDYVAIHLKLNKDSTFCCNWAGDVNSYYSFETYRIENDTLYFTSQYKDYHQCYVKANLSGDNTWLVHWFHLTN